MTDLLTQDNADQFRAAMRDLTDTFHKTAVTLERANGDEIPLYAGVKPVETGNDGEVNGGLYEREERAETVERWIVSLNRDNLSETGLVDPDDGLLITLGDRVIYNGKRFTIIALTDKALFRGVPILVRLEVAR